jgi:hypothetical protein
LHGQIFSLTPALSQKERELSPFSLRERAWDEGEWYLPYEVTTVFRTNEEAPNAIIGLSHWDNEQQIQLNNKEDACSF